MTAPEVKVTQADRDAAAAYYYSAGGSPSIAKAIRAGEKDTWFRVQVFARHRQSAEAASVAREQALVEALRGLLEHSTSAGMVGDQFADNARDLLAKIGGAS